MDETVSTADNKCESESEDYVALTRLFERDRKRLVRIALPLTQNEDEAEDVVQEAALRALVKLHTFRGESSLNTWLCAIIRNSAFNKFRPSRRRERSFDAGVLDYGDMFCCLALTSHLDPEQAALEGQLHEIVHSVVKGLKAPYRSAIQSCDLEGRSYLEAADGLHVNLPTFKARLNRGRKILRERVLEQVLQNKRSTLVVQGFRVHTTTHGRRKNSSKARTAGS